MSDHCLINLSCSCKEMTFVCDCTLTSLFEPHRHAWSNTLFASLLLGSLFLRENLDLTIFFFTPLSVSCMSYIFFLVICYLFIFFYFFVILLLPHFCVRCHLQFLGLVYPSWIVFQIKFNIGSWCHYLVHTAFAFKLLKVHSWLCLQECHV
jgi:hypothetical protein